MEINNTYPIIGMSPGNPYFKQEVVDLLIRSVVGRFGRAVILIADIPAIATYKALGYSENRARRDKAIPKGNALKNRAKNTILQSNYSDETVKIIDWKKEVEDDADYRKSYSKIRDLYVNNSEFRTSANITTQAVLEGSGKVFEDLQKSTEIAVHYLLAEFARLLLGTDNITYVYHKSWTIYEDYIAGKFDNIPKPHMSFLII